MSNVFAKPSDQYQRKLNPLQQYVEQTAQYMATMTGDPIEECRAYMNDCVKNKKFEGAVNPIVSFFQKQDNGDREHAEVPLAQYIAGVVKNNEVLAPTGTTYMHVTRKKSLLVGFLDAKGKRRKIAKTEMYVAKAAKNDVLFNNKNNEQTAQKLKSNATSGAFVAVGSVLNNPTGHSTLTSTTRNVSSFGNASNERVVSGNRHYWSYEIALFNIISIVNNTNYVVFEAAMTKYQLHYPTSQEVMDCVRWSTHLYWNSERDLAKIFQYVDRLQPIQKAAFVYTGDFYHVRQHNRNFTQRFLLSLSKKVTTCDCDDPVKYMKKLDEHTMALTHVICAEEVRGKGLNYDLIAEEGNIQTLVGTAQNVLTVIGQYKDFIEAIFLSDNVPPSVAYISSMQRRTVVLSDTDSTCFSVDEWIRWHYGHDESNDEAQAMGAVVAFVATQSVVHILAVLSANINVERERLHVLAMKNEFMWTVMATTSVAKHYYALTSVREGSVYDELELECKGVHLKNSSSPKFITDDAQRMMLENLTTVSQGRKIKIVPILEHIVALERRITESLLNGESEFYRRAKIKEAAAYKKGPDKSPYQNYVLWEEVFHAKYGAILPPPYGVIKIPTTLVNKTAVKNWLGGMTDRALADRMATWFLKNNKKTLPTFYISAEYMTSFGMIPEIRSVIDTRRIVLDLTKVYRLILESLGCFFKKDYTLFEQNGLNWKDQYVSALTTNG